MLINAVNEQQEQIEEQKTTIVSQTAEIGELKKLLAVQASAAERQQVEIAALRKAICSINAALTFCKP